MTNYKEILRMKANEFSIRAIANSHHCNWRTFKTGIQQADEIQGVRMSPKYAIITLS